MIDILGSLLELRVQDGNRDISITDFISCQKPVMPFYRAAFMRSLGRSGTNQTDDTNDFIFSMAEKKEERSVDLIPTGE